VELRQIRYFLSLAQTLNFTRAAEECNVTQPTLTQSIRKLEDELGGPLLLRQRNRTHLTHLGQTILPYLQNVYDGSQAAQEVAEDIAKGERMPLRVGVFEDFKTDFLGDAIREVSASVEGLELHIVIAKEKQLTERLQNGEMDIAILPQVAVDETLFRFAPLYSEGMKVALREEAVLAQKERVGLTDLKDETYICIRESTTHRDIVTYSGEAGVELRPIHWAHDCHTAQVMVRAGLGVAFVGECQPAIEGVVLRDLVEPIPHRAVGLAELRGKPSSGAVITLSSILRSRGKSDFCSSPNIE